MATADPRSLRIQLSYSRNPHLSQLYSGFQALERMGATTCEWDLAPAQRANSPATLSVLVDGRVMLHYDVLDGLNWVVGTAAENLDYFHANAPEGIYFKRSYTDLLNDYAPPGVTVVPLGLNYFVSPFYVPGAIGLRSRFERQLRDSAFLRRLLSIQAASFPVEDFEALPQLAGETRILMYTRLWDPRGKDVRSPREGTERSEINAARIEALLALREAFGSRFTGGIYTDTFSRSCTDPALLLSWQESEKHSYLAEMKRHAICVATGGLHGSIGWRFAEYVASSRAIVSEPLQFGVGGEFHSGRNYVEFSNVDELVNCVDRLLSDPKLMRSMMVANYRYYCAHLKPSALVLDTLVHGLALAEDNATRNP